MRPSRKNHLSLRLLRNSSNMRIGNLLVAIALIGNHLLYTTASHSTTVTPEPIASESKRITVTSGQHQPTTSSKVADTGSLLTTREDSQLIPASPEVVSSLEGSDNHIQNVIRTGGLMLQQQQEPNSDITNQILFGPGDALEKGRRVVFVESAADGEQYQASKISFSDHPDLNNLTADESDISNQVGAVVEDQHRGSKQRQTQSATKQLQTPAKLQQAQQHLSTSGLGLERRFGLFKKGHHYGAPAMSASVSDGPALAYMSDCERCLSGLNGHSGWLTANSPQTSADLQQVDPVPVAPVVPVTPIQPVMPVPSPTIITPSQGSPSLHHHHMQAFNPFQFKNKFFTKFPFLMKSYPSHFASEPYPTSHHEPSNNYWQTVYHRPPSPVQLLPQMSSSSIFLRPTSAINCYHAPASAPLMATAQLAQPQPQLPVPPPPPPSQSQHVEAYGSTKGGTAIQQVKQFSQVTYPNSQY